MTPTPRIRPHRAAVLLAAGVAAVLLSLPAHALYKVIGPDGKVTYTDRPDTSVKAKVLSMNPDSGSVAAAPLPLELRQAAARYPVSLYVSNGCAPCDSARELLVQRGIPFSEKLVSTNDDGEALQRLTGGREAPTLMIGSQTVRGFSAETWNSYLDAATYPRESRLPASYQRPPATPLVQRQDAGAQPAQRLEQTSTGIPVAPAADTAEPAEPAASGIRF